jgi:hypothetical protein
MSLTALIIFGVLLIALTLYIVMYVIYPMTTISDILPNMTDLSTSQDIYLSDKVTTTLLSSSGSTVMGFFKMLESGDRTIKLQNTLEYIPVMYITNDWYLEVSPAPINSSDTGARLRIKVNKSAQDEIIELPSIPKQKWMFVAIIRDGRRFDVIYNNKIVASQILSEYPMVVPSPLSVGNTGLSGSVIHVMVYGSALTPSDIEKERLSRVDTNGAVLEDNKIDLSLPTLKIFAQCPPGLPCDPITTPPPDNLLKWSTPYA